MPSLLLQLQICARRCEARELFAWFTRNSGWEKTFFGRSRTWYDKLHAKPFLFVRIGCLVNVSIETLSLLPIYLQLLVGVIILPVFMLIMINAQMYSGEIWFYNSFRSPCLLTACSLHDSYIMRILLLQRNCSLCQCTCSSRKNR